ncbi:MAG: DciA family protein [Microbacterium sp.]
MVDISDDRTATASDLPETVATYLRLRGLQPSTKNWKRKRRVSSDDDENAPFTPGRDPGALSDVLDKLAKDAGWQGALAREDLVLQWVELVGADTAKHSEPVSLERGMLTVKCDSTAWAKNLQYMRATILTEIGRRFPDAGVENLRFIGPDVPSWKWGPRVVPGRGPRDTYG